MPSLLSLVLAVHPPSAPPTDRPQPRWLGRAAHALLLKIIQENDRALAERLHAESDLRPFTASSLWQMRTGAAEAAGFPRDAAFLRFTAFHQAPAQILAEAVQPAGSLAPGKTVELDFIPFQILKTYTQPQEHGWAAQSDYAELSAPYLLAKHNPPRRIRLQLASPTAFKSGGKHIPLPLPELVFGSLLEKWNAFAPVALPDETRRYAAECLTITQHRLRSELVYLKEGSTRSGTQGEVTFTSLNYDRYWMSLIHTLAKFALFSGVGISASMGMGQVREG
ncbi:MAG: CRISPR-associated endoribonuclease Cas6 [Anaerolineales bacterium]